MRRLRACVLAPNLLPAPRLPVRQARGDSRLSCLWKDVSGRVADPDLIGSVDPDPYSESGSESRRAKMTQKSRNFFEKF
jgi:hypothetical protein